VGIIAPEFFNKYFDVRQGVIISFTSSENRCQSRSPPASDPDPVTAAAALTSNEPEVETPDFLKLGSLPPLPTESR
jgi:hypothetical protein